MDKNAPWVFHDPSRKRWMWARTLGLVAAVGVAACAVAFVFTLVTIPSLPRIPEIAGKIRRTINAAVPRPPRREARLREFLLSRSRRALMREIDAEKNVAATARNGRSIVAAFYAPWQPTGINSLNANIDAMTHVMPAWLRVSRDGTGLDFTDWTLETNPRNAGVIAVARTHGVSIDPVLTNAEQSVFDPDRVHLLFSDPQREQRLAWSIRDWLRRNAFHGLNVDFENLRPEDAKHVPAFLALLRDTLHPAGLELSIDLEGESRKPLLTMPLQRFVYRQLMCAVIWRSVKTAVKGIRTGWGKLDRKNTVSVGA